MGSGVFLAIARRASQRDRDDRVAFLHSSAACQETACDCPLCSAQPSTKPAYHVTAYMIVGLLLPWCDLPSLLFDNRLVTCISGRLYKNQGPKSVV